MPLTDGYEPMEPIVPGQADPEPVENILDPRCWCGRLLEPTRYETYTAWYCSRHGRMRTPFDA